MTDRATDRATGMDRRAFLGGGALAVAAALTRMRPGTAHAAVSVTPITLVCIGDSITAGLFLAAGNRFSDRLATDLKARFGPNNVTVINAGIAGNSVCPPAPPGQLSMTQRFATDVLGVPGVTHCLIFGGINDCWSGTDPTTICLGVEQMVNQGLAAGLVMRVATITPQAATEPNWKAPEPTRQAVNNWMRAVWGGPPNAQFGLLDFDAVLCGPSPWLDPQYTIGAPDGLHFNAYGHLWLADLANRFLP